MARAREWQRARPWARERAPGGGGKTGWTSLGFLGWLQEPHWIWVRETSLEEDPRAFPTQRKDTGGVASGWSRGHTQCWGEPGRPQRNGRNPVLQTTLEQKAGGLGVGQGAGRLKAAAGPLLVPQGSSQHPNAVCGSCHPPEKCKSRAWESC